MKHPFTETYIRMVAAAPELQEVRPRIQARMPSVPPHPGMGSIFCKPLEPAFRGWEFRVLAWSTVASQWVIADFDETEDAYFWIPRLDQLVGMIGYPEKFLDASLVEGRFGPAVLRFDGLNRDWHEFALAVVMAERYGKTWNGKAWVKGS